MYHRRMMRRLGSLSLAVMVLLPAMAALARAQAPTAAPVATATPPLVVAEPATIGTDPASATTFANLLRDALAKQGYTVISRARTPTIPCGEPACASQVMAPAGAQLGVVTTLSQLGNKVIVQVALVDGSGQVRFSDRVTANGVEDLDPLSGRIAVAIATNKPIGETVTVSTVTSQEARPNLRKQSLYTTGVRIGGGFPAFSSYGGDTGLFDIGMYGMWELNEFAIVLEGDYRWDANSTNTSVHAFNLDIGGRYYLNPEDDSGFFISAGLGFRAVSLDANDSTTESFGAQSGLGGYVGAGVTLLRTSDIHVTIDGRFDFDFFKDGDSNLDVFLVSVGISVAKWHWF